MSNQNDLEILNYNQDMKNETQLIVDEGCIEILVDYDYCNNDEEVMEGERKPYLVKLNSVEQNCFHLENLEDYISDNVKRCLPKLKCNEYRLVCVCNSDIEGDSYIEEFRKMQTELQKKSVDGLINKALYDNE